jgi:hypothetical protein
MDTVCAESSRQPDVLFNQQRTVGGAGGANDGRQRGLGMGLGPGREPNERTSDRRGFERLSENLSEGVGVGGRQKRSDEIERAARRGLRGQRRQQRVGSGTEMSPTIAAKWRSRQGFGSGLCARMLWTRTGRSRGFWRPSVRTRREGARLARRPPMAL